MPPPATRVEDIPVSDIDVGQQQLRHTPNDESIGELAESIAAKGLLQPIGVTRTQNHRYQLRWGHRRLLAHLRLNRQTIRATVYDGDEQSIKGLALVENLHRSSMTLEEEAGAVRYLQHEEGKSIEQIADIANKSRSWVLNRLMIPDLADFLRQPLLEGHLSFAHLEILAHVPEETAQRYLVAQCLQNSWNTSQLRSIAECYLAPADFTPPRRDGVPGVNPNPIDRPFFYTCDACGEKGELQEFTLVRVHKNGCRSDALANRSNHPSGGDYGLGSHPDGHERPINRTDYEAPKAAPRINRKRKGRNRK